jgi:PHD/YefM family antitoxin component YafN of YafNO toxin-antitoxin module
MDDIVRISAGELDEEPTRYRKIALTHPVFITSEGHDETVIISAEEYRRLKRRARRVLGIEDFTEEQIEAIRRAQPPAEASAFDHEYQPRPR